MNRRDLFRMLPAATVGLAIPSRDIVVDREEYRGFRLCWNGWFKHYNMQIQTAYWSAMNPDRDGLHVYSAYPGATEKCFAGQVMDLSVQPWQKCPLPDWTDEELNSAKAQAFTRLTAYIDAHYEELTHAIR